MFLSIWKGETGNWLVIMLINSSHVYSRQLGDTNQT